MVGRSDAAQSQFARPEGVNKLVMEPAKFFLLKMEKICIMLLYR